MRNTMLALAVLLFACSCGGGGGIDDLAAVTVDQQTLPPQVETDVDKAQEMLEDHAVDAVDGLQDVLELLKGISDGTAAMPTYEITDINLLNVALTLEVDLDDEGPPEAMGVISCVDGNGDPTLPVSISDALAVLDGTLDVWEVLNDIEDGTVLLVEMDYDDGDLVASADAGIVWEDGWPDYAYGGIVVDAAACTLTLSFEQVDAGIWFGSYPTCEAEIELETENLTLSGTLSLDGTDTAVIVVTFDDEETYTFTLDLDTGEVTTAP